MSKHYDLFSKMLMWLLTARLNSGKMRRFEADNSVSAEQQRLLVFGAIMFTQHMESCRTLKTIRDKKDMLASWWVIDNREEALSTAKKLSTANTHTAFADGVYRTMVQGRPVPLCLEDLPGITGLEKSFLNVFNREFAFEDMPVRNALSELGYAEDTLPQVKSIMAQDFGLAAFPSYMEDTQDIIEPENSFQGISDHAVDFEDTTVEMQEEEIELVREIILSEFAGRVNKGIEAYKTARDMLLDLGYTEDELFRIKSTAAWDFGRAVSITRYCVNSGYMEESEAWEFMQAAADNAVKIYRDWREYLAGYILGRSLGWGDDSYDLYVQLRYLLKNSNSPFSKVSFNK